MERYTDDPPSSSHDNDDLEDYRLSHESETTVKHSSSSSSPDESESFIRRKVTDLPEDAGFAGYRPPRTYGERIRQGCFNLMARARRRWILLGVLAAALALTAGLTVMLVFLLKEPPRPPPEPELGRAAYCTTWPVEETRGGKYAFPKDSGYASFWEDEPMPYNSTTIVDGYTKPTEFKIVAIVFYGRKEYVDVLDCYLERNLASNGGFLDEIRFLARTEEVGDLEYLDELVANNEHYSRVEVNELCRSEHGRYDCMWEDLTEENTMYIKIDDDVVWIDDDAIPNLVRMRVENKEAYAIGSNLVNSHLMAWPQWHSGSVYAFLPEVNQTNRTHLISWRNSELPAYDGEISDVDPNDFNVREYFAEPPYRGHRWLPLPRDSPDILHTPMFGVEHEDLGIVVEQWSLGAQMHMSLLQNLENGTLSRYWIGNGEGIWHPEYRRYNLNFAAIWSSDIRDTLPFDGDDEQYVTVTAPIRLARPFLVADHSLVAHFHFGPQTDRMRYTDLLDRYRAYANEFICPLGRKRMPLFAPCDGF